MFSPAEATEKKTDEVASLCPFKVQLTKLTGVSLTVGKKERRQAKPACTVKIDESETRSLFIT